MNLIAEEGAYNLIVDSQLPMGQLILQSKQNLDVLNVKNNLAKISRITQIADPQIQSLTHLFIDGGEGDLSGQSRIEVKIRTSEGQKGNIQLIVMAQNKRLCQSTEVVLPPLNLHQKLIEVKPEDKAQLKLSKLVFKN